MQQLARNRGFPTTHHAALDGDVLLAAQARRLATSILGERVIVATTNVAHLEQFVEAKNWPEI